MVVEALNTCPGVTCIMPEGAFYAFPTISGCLGKKTPNGQELITDENFVIALLETTGVALVHGTAFGTPGHMRISYAAATESLVEAMKRLKTFCESLTDE